MNRNRILIVEDEFIVARNLQKRLMNLGFSVPALAATAQQAIQEAQRTQPDLVLMDIRLEGEGDGIAAAREIHERLDIPVVYLTAYADAETIRRAKVAEPFGFLPKPFGLRELQTTIEVALYKHSVDRRMRRSERWLNATLRSIGDAVIAADEQGVVTLMNPAAEAMTGPHRHDTVGQPIAEVLSAGAMAPGRGDGDWAAAALSEGRLLDLTGDMIVRAADGRETPVACAATPLTDKRGAPIGVVLLLHDLTERLRAEGALHDGERRYRQVTAELQDALGRIETLRGLLTVCSSCHRVRDAQGEWHELDDDIVADTDAGRKPILCPRCARNRSSAPPGESD